MRKLQAETDALAASVKVEGRPDGLPPSAMLAKQNSEHNDDDNDEEEDDDNDDDDDGGGDSTQPLSIRTWGTKPSVLEHMRDSGKLQLPAELGIKEPWYIESQKRAAEAAAAAARKADEEATAAVAASGGGGGLVMGMVMVIHSLQSPPQKCQMATNAVTSFLTWIGIAKPMRLAGVSGVPTGSGDR